MAKIPDITVSLNFDAEKYKAEVIKATREAISTALQQVIDRMEEFVTVREESTVNPCGGGTH
jgi:hypothetical protein